VGSAEENFEDELFASTLAELEELTRRMGPANKYVGYVLHAWNWFSIYTEPSSNSESRVVDPNLPHVIQVPSGWTALDYEDGIVTSIGKNYTGYSTSTGSLLRTVEYMVECLAKRGVKAVAFAGSLLAKRMAWILCTRYGIRNQFSPNAQDLKCREGLEKALLRRPFSYKT
jgi:hypothetical protein